MSTTATVTSGKASTDKVRAGLSRRHAAEKRFQLYGMIAIFLAVLFLCTLLFSIVSKGYTAFLQTEIKLEIDISAEEIDPGGKRDPGDLSRADYQGPVRDALRKIFPHVEGRTQRRDLNALLSSGAGFELREKVLADPSLIGTQQTLWLPLDDEVDTFVKGSSSDVVTIATGGIASPTGTEGEIKVLSTANDFTAILSEVKEFLVRQADDSERDLRRSRRALESVGGELTGLKSALANAQAENNTERAASLTPAVEAATAELERYQGVIAHLEERIADLRRRADAPGGREQLSDDLPSYLVRINNGLVKVTVVENTGISGDVLSPLASTEDARPGSWEIVQYATPQTARRLNDRQLTWIGELQQRGVIEAQFNTALFTHGDSREPEQAGILGALMGSFFVLIVTLALSFPLGVAAAVYLEEFAPKNRLTDIIEVNINNLAAVPSIVFGLLGLAVFINFFGMPRSAPLVGGLVLTLMTLPTIIIASRAALKAVPPSIREAALGMGASKMQMIGHHVFPLAIPGMLTGTIIGMAQALGETAPLLMIGMIAFIVDVPGGFFDPATVMPVQIFLWSDLPERAFVERASAAIMVLLGFLVLMNLLAVILRKRFERRW
jgi:phosphate transport system permease protein